MAAPAPTLDEIRAEIDRIDQAVHDLLMRRVEVVRGIGRLKGASAPKWRPAREAALIRRLVARHRGEMPVGVLVRIWREMIVGGSLALQEAVTISVAADSGCWDLARDHFGAVVPLRVRRSAAQVVRDVAAGKATIGVLPVPEAGTSWWRPLAGKDTPRIVAKLPFAAIENGRAGPAAYAIACIAFEPSGSDRSLLVVETVPPASRAALASALHKAGLSARRIAQDGAAARAVVLLEVDGFVGDGDRRLAALKGDPCCRRVAAIGGYALPLSKS
ncbi:MAG: chorismate mutase [Alphaproteobacteria bacterium]|nr:chorismate mutase [Alphaproteobacteria bacterium]